MIDDLWHPLFCATDFFLTQLMLSLARAAPSLAPSPTSLEKPHTAPRIRKTFFSHIYSALQKVFITLCHSLSLCGNVKNKSSNFAIEIRRKPVLKSLARTCDVRPHIAFNGEIANAQLSSNKLDSLSLNRDFASVEVKQRGPLPRLSQDPLPLRGLPLKEGRVQESAEECRRVPFCYFLFLKYSICCKRFCAPCLVGYVLLNGFPV